MTSLTPDSDSPRPRSSSDGGAPHASHPRSSSDGGAPHASHPRSSSDGGAPHASHPRVTLIGKSGCHLCDDARAVVAAVCAETGEEWAELSIEDDPALYDEHWDRIPVVLVDGRPHDFWRVDGKRLRAALTTESGNRPI